MFIIRHYETTYFPHTVLLCVFCIVILLFYIVYLVLIQGGPKSCTFSTHHILGLQTVPTTGEGTPFSGSMNTALCDL